jgi:hypothetical protein
MATSRLRVT